MPVCTALAVPPTEPLLLVMELRRYKAYAIDFDLQGKAEKKYWQHVLVKDTVSQALFKETVASVWRA